MEVSIEHVQLKFIKELKNNIVSLKVNNNIMCFVLNNGLIFLIDLLNPANVTKYQIPLFLTNNERVLACWMNCSASYVILKTNFAKYYLCKVDSMINNQKDTNKFLPLKKLNKKNCNITTVDWSFDENQVLLGTNNGNVYLLNILDQTLTKMYNDENNLSIDGISWIKSKTALLVIKNTIMHWKSGKDPLTTFEKKSPDGIEQFQHLDDEFSNKFAFYDGNFAWIMQSGIVFGKSSNDNNDSMLSSAKVLLNIELPESKDKIRDILLTKYHIIILRDIEILIINQLSNQVVFQKIISRNEIEKSLGLSIDYSQTPPTIWYYSSSNIYEIILKNETKNVWKLLCDSYRFDESLSLIDLGIIEKNFIFEKKADYLYEQQNFKDAAISYANSSTVPIGSTSLKFINLDNPSYLQTFLIEKLNHLIDKNQSSTNQVKGIILSSWIIWNFMNQINHLEEMIKSTDNIEILEKLKKEKEISGLAFQDFLVSNLDCLEKETVYQIISRQNRKRELLFFANLIQDYQFVLSYWIKLENWYESLKVLISLQDPESVYKYATILLINAPDLTINAWMQIPELNPVELIPSLLTYFTNYRILSKARSMQNYALNYLKWCIRKKGCKENIVHNTTLYMMIIGNDTDNTINEQEIIKFIQEDSINFDDNFILRLSLRFKRFSVSIHLYIRLKLFEDAVTLATSKGLLSTAKLIANLPELNNKCSLKRKLWLRIAKVIIMQGDDIKESIKKILEDSDGTLTIQDLLPLFDEFTTIANLKEELIKGLQHHSNSMSEITTSIERSIKVKHEIEKDMEFFKKRFQNLTPGDSCNTCGKFLLSRKFYVFPCGHNFHTDCMVKDILRSNNFNLKNQIENYQKKWKQDRNSLNVDQLDELLSRKCCLCSDIKINLIDEPLHEDINQRSTWIV